MEEIAKKKWKSSRRSNESSFKMKKEGWNSWSDGFDRNKKKTDNLFDFLTDRYEKLKLKELILSSRDDGNTNMKNNLENSNLFFDSVRKVGENFVIKFGVDKYFVVGKTSKKQKCNEILSLSDAINDSSEENVSCNIETTANQDFVEVAKLMNEMVYFVSVKSAIAKYKRTIRELELFQKECWGMEIVKTARTFQKESEKRGFNTMAFDMKNLLCPWRIGNINYSQIYENYTGNTSVNSQTEANSTNQQQTSLKNDLKQMPLSLQKKISLLKTLQNETMRTEKPKRKIPN